MSFMFSKSHGLMCSVQKSGEYYVVNGAWNGVRRGDEFDVMRGGTVLSTQVITDWVELETSYWPEEAI